MAGLIQLPKRNHPDFISPKRQPGADVKVIPSVLGSVVYAFHPPANRDIVTARNPAITDGARIENRTDGTGYRCESTTATPPFPNVNYGLYPRLSGVQPFTVIWHGIIESLGVTASNVRWSGTNNNTGYLFRTTGGSGATITCFLNSMTPSGSGDRVNFATGGTDYVGKLLTIVFAFRGIGLPLDAWLKTGEDQAEFKQSTGNVTGGTYSDSDFIFRAETESDITHYFAAALDTALSPELMNLWVNNPWIILEPNTPPVYFRKDERIVAQPAEYSIVGQSVDLLHDQIITGDAGAYVIAGQSASLLHDVIISASSGSYLIDGQSVDILHDAIITGDAGAYVMTGADADIIEGQIFVVQAGTYTITGGDVETNKPWSVQINSPGTWTKQDGGI